MNPVELDPRPMESSGRWVERLDSAAAGLEQGRRRLDALIAEARSGRHFQPAELLAIQAEVFRISETAALTQKVVQAGTDGVRRLWSMQL